MSRKTLDRIHRCPKCGGTHPFAVEARDQSGNIKLLKCKGCNRSSSPGTIERGTPPPRAVPIAPGIDRSLYNWRLRQGWDPIRAATELPKKAAANNPPCPDCGKAAFRHTTKPGQNQRWRCKPCRKVWTDAGLNSTSAVLGRWLEGTV